MSNALLTLANPNAFNVQPPRHAAPTSRVAIAHRQDIEGLRGVAVLSLLAVHLFPQWDRGGGILGLDMFFVLSGYLVSDALFRAHDAGDYSLRGFYADRLQRIVPSLILVLLSCLAFSWLFTTPNVTMVVGAHAAAAAVFISNFASCLGTGTLGLRAEESPLYHLWALALGVQFCILWPIALGYLLKRRQSVLVAVGSALLCSFLLNVAWVASEPNATLLLLPTRLWQLLAGALLACFGRLTGRALGAAKPGRAPRLQCFARECSAWSGIGLLFVAVLLIDRTQHFPGWWALLPTAGTVALLYAGPDASVNRRFLSHPVLRFYGVISYPLYLWHWPLLTFPVVMGMPLTDELRVIILIASVVLAALTHELVEKNTRLGLRGSSIPVALVSALACVGLLGYAVQQSNGLLKTFPQTMQRA